MSDWFQNGERVTAIDTGSRALQYGDGLFETVAIRDGEPRLWTLHAERLTAGCRRLAISLPGDERLRNLLRDAVEKSSQDPGRCTAKLIVSSGVSKRGYARDVPAAPDILVGVFKSEALAAGAYRDGVDTMLCETRLALHSVTAGLKTLNRLEQVLARAECAGKPVFEGLTLDADGLLICGTMSNVFIVSDSSIHTPSLSRCGVAGVMRQHTINVLQANGMPVAIRTIKQSELSESDELFLTNSQFGVLPVRRCGDTTWPSHPVTSRIMSMVAASGVGDCAL